MSAYKPLYTMTVGQDEDDEGVPIFRCDLIIEAVTFTGFGPNCNAAMVAARTQAFAHSDRIHALACRAVPADDCSAAEEGSS